MLGQFSGQQEFNGGLDFTRRKGSLLVISDELAGFQSGLLENIVDEGVHNIHGLLGDTGIRVNLLEDLVDVKRESFISSSLALLVGVLGGIVLGGLLLSFGGGGLFGGHV